MFDYRISTSAMVCYILLLTLCFVRSYKVRPEEFFFFSRPSFVSRGATKINFDIVADLSMSPLSADNEVALAIAHTTP